MFETPFPRLTGLGLVSVLLFIACLFTQEQHPGSLIAVSLYKLHMASLAGWAGYWLDRLTFPYSRPHKLLDQAEDRTLHGVPPPQLQDTTDYLYCDLYSHYNQATLRRAIIIAACVIGICLGA